MYITCLDMEGVLVPEIWIAFAQASGIPELRRTTRDEPDYDKLMRYRLDILKEHGLGLKEIQATIAKIDPLPGAREFLDELRSFTQVIILSDTFEEFAQPLMRQLGWPTIFCHYLETNEAGNITNYKLRQPNHRIRVFQAIVGGIIAGFGARLAMGCNLAAFFTGIPQFSLHAWFFAIATAIGSLAGAKVRRLPLTT